MKQYNKVIIGAGFYGLYAALFCCKKGQHIVVLECDSAPFKRATYINQARVHQGYHYPRSISTAMKSAGYFERFSKEYAFCINKEFDQIYAISSQYSWTDGRQIILSGEHTNIIMASLNNIFHQNVSKGFRNILKDLAYDYIPLKRFDRPKMGFGILSEG